MRRGTSASRTLAAVAGVLLAGVGSIVGAGCGGADSVASPGAPSEVLSVKLETAHFRLWADRAAPATLREIADALEAELPRISADLAVTAMPVTTVDVWTDRESFYADMVATTGTRYEGATGYVPNPTRIKILAVSAPARSACHELVHCVSLRLNATIGNNPRWLWETAALYENGEFVDPRGLSYLVAGSFPTLAQLNAGYSASRQIYEVGFLLGEFIVATWGREGLVGLLASNGDVARVCGVSVDDFERRWAAYVRQKYFS
jgi:hypothetical protein